MQINRSVLLILVLYITQDLMLAVRYDRRNSAVKLDTRLKISGLEVTVLKVGNDAELEGI